MNVGKDTTLGDGNVSEKFVQLFIVADGELKMTRNDTGLLVVTGGIAGQFENFGCQVLKDGSEVDGSTCDSSLGCRFRCDFVRLAYQHQRAERSCLS